MSLKNILEPNNNDLYCRDLNIAGSVIIPGGGTIENINISGTLTIENTGTLDLVSGSDIIGTANFANGSFLNFANGSLIEGDAKIGNGGTFTFNGNTSLNITSNADLNVSGTTTFASGSTLNFPTQTLTVTPKWTDGGLNYAVTPATVSVTFYKIGKFVTMNIEIFQYVGLGPSGYFYINFTSINSEFLPTSYQQQICGVINNDQSEAGYMICNPVDSRFEFRICGTSNANDYFSGAVGKQQGIGSKEGNSYVPQPCNMSITYIVD